jgi:hypothetical protein
MLGLLKQADKEGNKNQKVDHDEMQSIIDTYSDGNDAFSRGLGAVMSNAKKRAGNDEPSLAIVNSVIKDGVKAIGQGKGQAPTWKAISAFAKRYGSLKLSDVLLESSARGSGIISAKRLVAAYWDDNVGKGDASERDMPGARSRFAYGQIYTQNTQDGPGAQSFEVGGKTFYGLQTNNSGNGQVYIFDKHDKLVAMDSFNEG